MAAQGTPALPSADGYDSDFNSAVQRQQQISQSSQGSDFSADTLSLSENVIAEEVQAARVEIDPTDAERMILALEQQIQQLRLQIPSYSSAMMHPDEMDALMMEVEKSIVEGIKATIITHIEKKPAAPGAPEGTKTLFQLLRTSYSSANPNAELERERVVENFLALNAAPLRERLRETIVQSMNVFSYPDAIRSILENDRLKPKPPSPGRAAKCRNGLTLSDIGTMGKEVFFIFNTKIHRVVITPKPHNAEFDNTNINETRITKTRARALWDKHMLHHIATIQDPDIDKKKAVSSEDMLVDQAQTRAALPSPAAAEDNSQH